MARGSDSMTPLSRQGVGTEIESMAEHPVKQSKRNSFRTLTL
jgi:hypothetical protein